jgi:uncharacterized protein
MQTSSTPPDKLPDGRPGELVRLLGLMPHPEGGWFREIHRSTEQIFPPDGRGARSALTTIDFLLAPGEFSAWHSVASDEVWHLLEGGPLALWVMSPEGQVEQRCLAAVEDDSAALRRRAPTASSTAHLSLVGPRSVVPAGWWQAAVPLQGYAYVGATVAPGFDFADFAFLRNHAAACAQLKQAAPTALRYL